MHECRGYDYIYITLRPSVNLFNVLSVAESIEGTVKPMSNCEVVYYGVTSSPVGHIVGPPDSPLLRLSTFPLVCAHTFLPSSNQSVSITFDRAGHDSANVALPGS